MWSVICTVYIHIGIIEMKYGVSIPLGVVTPVASWNFVINGTNEGLSPVQQQVITWTNDELLSIKPLRTNFSETGIKIENFSHKETLLKILFSDYEPFCWGCCPQKGC